jgi:hypothetical protein
MMCVIYEFFFLLGDEVWTSALISPTLLLDILFTIT